jgi:hypothetical protein
MSHFTVAVFSRSPAEVDMLLEPYCEGVDSGSPYAEFEEEEGADFDAVAGKRGYWRNPNAHWDWYGIGGRWMGLLKLKEGKTGRYGKPSWMNEDVPRDPGHCDQALVVDCDFSPDPDAYDRALRMWEIQVEDSPLREDERPEDHVRFYKPEYYIRQYGTKEKYAKNQSAFHTFSFVTADGEWIEEGHMGWFGISDTTVDSREAYQDEFEAYLKLAETEGMYITIVDSHI